MNTEIGNTACRVVTDLVSKIESPNDWSRGYYRGQLAIIECYLYPDREVLREAQMEVDKIHAK